MMAQAGPGPLADGVRSADVAADTLDDGTTVVDGMVDASEANSEPVAWLGVPATAGCVVTGPAAVGLGGADPAADPLDAVDTADVGPGDWVGPAVGLVDPVSVGRSVAVAGGDGVAAAGGDGLVELGPSVRVGVGLGPREGLAVAVAAGPGVVDGRAVAVARGFGVGEGLGVGFNVGFEVEDGALTTTVPVIAGWISQ
jgi:hypothetical protein